MSGSIDKVEGGKQLAEQTEAQGRSGRPNERSNASAPSTDKPKNSSPPIYGSWPAGVDRALIATFAIRRGEAVFEFRYVGRGSVGERASIHVVATFDVDQLDQLHDVVRKARADAKRWKLEPTDKERPTRRPAKRWGNR